MPTFKLRTGNLSEVIANTAVTYTKRAEFTGAEFQIADNKRWCFIGYKVSEADSKDATKELPASFAVALPTVFDVPPEWDSFCLALALDYQDTLVHKVADFKATIDPTDWAAVIADYYSEKRNRTTPTLAAVAEWMDAVWIPAYMIRAEQLGTAKAIVERVSGPSGYPSYAKQIAKATCGLLHATIIGFRQSTTRLMEQELIDKDDSIALFMLLRCEQHLVEQQVIEDVGI